MGSLAERQVWKEEYVEDSVVLDDVKQEVTVSPLQKLQQSLALAPLLLRTLILKDHPPLYTLCNYYCRLVSGTQHHLASADLMNLQL